MPLPKRYGGHEQPPGGRFSVAFSRGSCVARPKKWIGSWPVGRSDRAQPLILSIRVNEPEVVFPKELRYLFLLVDENGLLSLS